MTPPPPPTPNPNPTIFFLSDYGTHDEFVGVVHAVIATAAPGTTVIDLTHQIPPFDVRAGAATLVRAAPHLGHGVVLGVVDPGVGSRRRGLCIRVDGPPPHGPMFFVGPDNGLLVAAAELIAEAPLSDVTELRRAERPDDVGSTFDGRDLFALAAAALSRGTPPEQLGDPVDPASVVRLPGGVVEQGRSHDGRACLRAEVTWVDHFGNVQLAATAADARAAGIPLSGSVELMAPSDDDDANSLKTLPPALVPQGMTLRCVAAFADLERSELGLLVDSNGHLAVVAGEASAAHWLNMVAGDLVVLAW